MLRTYGLFNGARRPGEGRDLVTFALTWVWGEVESRWVPVFAGTTDSVRDWSFL